MNSAVLQWASFFAGLSIGFLVGGVFGLFVCSLCMAASREDRDMWRETR